MSLSAGSSSSLFLSQDLTVWCKPQVPCLHHTASITGVPPFLISETLLTGFLEMLPLGSPGVAGLPVPAGEAEHIHQSHSGAGSG